MFGSEHLHLSSLLVPRCEFFDGRNPSHSKDHIGYLPRLHASAAEKLEETGVESISDIPDDFPLSELQRRACTAVQTDDRWFSAELGKELEPEVSAPFRGF